MLTAVQPWSGFYGDDIDGSLPVVWATAHVTQFTDVGWHYLKNGSGSGTLPQGGYYASFVSPDSSEFTMNIAKISREHAPCTRPKLPEFDVAEETVSFTLTDATITTLHYYYSNYEVEQSIAFEKQADVQVVGGKFSLKIPIGAFITLSTREGNKGSIPTRPASAPAFPLPYKDDFQGYPDSQEAHYFSDQIGAFEIHPETAGSSNLVMQQMVPALPIGWGDPGTFGPMTLIGMREHQDVTVQVKFKLPTGSPSIAAGCVGTRADQMWHNAIVFCVEASGNYNVAVGGPKLGTNNFTHVYKTGVIPGTATGIWHTISLTTVGGSASGSFDGKQVFSGVAIRDIDSGFAVIGGSHWLSMQYDAFSLELATAREGAPPPPAKTAGNDVVSHRAMRSDAAAGSAICNTNCSRNGVIDATQEFDIDSNWNIVHKKSGNCVTSASDGSLTLQVCTFGNDAQGFLNDYTRIRAGTVPMTTRDNHTLVGTSDGKVATLPGGGWNSGGWNHWTYFPNTKQLRNQHVADLALGYPRCLAVC